MFFPVWNFFTKLCGATSLNSVILPKEIRDARTAGYNEVIHKDLRKLLAGKDVSRKGLGRLLDTYLDYAQERNIDVSGQQISQLREQIEIFLSDRHGSVQASELRANLSESLGHRLPPKTFDALCTAILSSLAMNERIRQVGPSALLSHLEQSDDPVWTPFFVEMAKRLKGANNVPTDVAACLQIMGRPLDTSDLLV